MKLGVVLAAAAACWWGRPSPALAQTTPEEQDLQRRGLDTTPAGDETNPWSVSIGAGVGSRPVYDGASNSRANVVPLVSVRYGDFLFIGPGGLGMNFLGAGNFRAGVLLGFLGGRRESDDSRLKGLGDVSASGTAGVYSTYRLGSLMFSATVRQSITHSSNGLIGSLQADYNAPALLGRKLRFVIGPDVEFVDSDFARTWFGVDNAQAVQSGLPVFTPGAGLKDYGLHFGATYVASEHILLRAYGSVKELSGPIGDSPIVQDRTQAFFGLGAAYHF